jgi:hypothetical protein
MSLAEKYLLNQGSLATLVGATYNSGVHEICLQVNFFQCKTVKKKDCSSGKLLQKLVQNFVLRRKKACWLYGLGWLL